MNGLKDKVALVTGAGDPKGIGFAIATKLAGYGVHIVLNDIAEIKEVEGSQNSMNDLCAEIGSLGVRCIWIAADITDINSVAHMAGCIKDEFGHLNILCNNAGATISPNFIHLMDDKAWKRTIDVNLSGTFITSKAMIPLMKKGDCIINIASRAGKVPALGNGTYSISKAGVIMLTKVMAKELGFLDMGIRVNALCPGQINTAMRRWGWELEAQLTQKDVADVEEEARKTIPLGRIGTPEDVANAAAFLASDEASYLTGQAINITGGQLMEL